MSTGGIDQFDGSHTPPDSAQDTPASHFSDASSSSEDTISPTANPLPTHPVPRFQNAFNESIRDSMHLCPDYLTEKLSAEARRRQLLELEEFTGSTPSRWNQRPGSKYHPLWKLIAQISFGIHLLHKQMAESELEVAKMLQEHVDEIDSFIEDTIADFDLAIKDVEERLQALQLPLSAENSRTFNRMLCERSFRQSIIDGNEIIERIITRTTVAMSQSLKDANKGLDASRELAKFLERIGTTWTKDDPNLLAIFNAMKGNSEGWLRCFDELNTKSERLTDLMAQLNSVVEEVAKRCGIASRRKTPTGVVGRKSIHSIRASSIAPAASVRPPRISKQFDKPLPPPPLQHQRQPSSIRSSFPRTSPEPDTSPRPPFATVKSSDTIDCLRDSPRQSQLSQRTCSGPSHSNASTQSLPSNEPAASFSSLNDLSNLSTESTVTTRPKADRKLSRNSSNAPEILEFTSQPMSCPASTTTSPPAELPSDPLTQISPLEGSPSKTYSVFAPLAIYSPPGLSMFIKSERKSFFSSNNKPVELPPMTGLGIDPAPMEPVELEDSAKSRESLPPNPFADPPDTIPQKTDSRRSVLPSGTDEKKASVELFSPFPPTRNPRLTVVQNEDKRASTNSYSDKIVVVDGVGLRSEAPSLSGPDSSYSSSENHSVTTSPCTSQATQTLNVPFSPDELSPNAALTSHPVTWDVATPPSPSTCITALPKCPPGTEPVPQDDLIPPANLRKPSFLLAKKPSLNNVRNLFTRKQSRKESWLGSGGLGGFVEVRQ